ncbi:GNAT family N-acetyltransferase [Acetobacter sp. AN02]|uniref:GNAT family N-acetyltransferase n=1 Tax=Acetobacter sp. AN02 TaxID=2894186 RepID=UPI0024344E9C|nr:GNAT family N-acetyltransferase [Acetobacter sp. AN02]MDG6093582.1 GNAT family N-acetyltransferase [Acetobacter sp. AN02]
MPVFLSALSSHFPPETGAALARMHQDMFVRAEQWAEKDFTDMLNMPGSAVWLARSGETEETAEDAGFLLARAVADEAEILTFGIRPDFRHNGIARTLLSVFAQDMQTLGVTRLLLEVATRNTAARTLYERDGYTETGYRRAYYPDGDDALILCRLLT